MALRAAVDAGAGGTVVTSVTGTANEVGASPTSGAVVVSLPAALTFTGKTVTGGTFSGPTLSGTVAGTPTFSGAVAFSSTLTVSGITRADGYLGIGAAPSINAPINAVVSNNANTLFTAKNSNAGSSALTGWIAQNDSNSYIGILQNSSTSTYLGGAGSSVLIATASPMWAGTVGSFSFTLGTNSQTAITIDTSQGVTVASLAGSGSRAVLASAAGLLSAPVSNEDWKENWEDLDGLTIAKALKLGWFDWKKEHQADQGAFRDFGIGAQTAAKVVGPALAGKDANGWYANRDKLGIIALAAVRQLEARLVALEDQIAALKV